MQEILEGLYCMSFEEAKKKKNLQKSTTNCYQQEERVYCNTYTSLLSGFHLMATNSNFHKSLFKGRVAHR